jgi:LysM repeat protein
VSFPTDTPEASNTCPHLGLADDADSHATYATEAHRCFRLANPTRIATGHQDSFCLGANHTQCPVFQGEGVEATTAPAAAPPPLEEPEAQAPTWSSSADEPPPAAAGAPPPPEAPPPAAPPRRTTGSVGGGRPGGGLSMPAATIGLFALAIVVVIVAFFINQQLGDDNGAIAPADVLATQSAQTAAAGGPTSTQPGDIATATTSVEVPTATTSVTEEPTETPTPEGGQTYEVQSGDTLGAIAVQFNTTVEALVAANNLADSNAIFAGQILIIP